jgi:hypothetical protein
LNKYILVLLFFFAVILAAATDIRPDRSGISIHENISDFSFEVLSIDGKDLKKCIFPKEYSKAGLYPETEYYERVFYFSAPEGSDPRLEISLNSSISLSNSELVPSQKFIKGKSGLISESYELPVKREDRESEHAEIVFFGQLNGMNLYRLLLRPMIVKNDQAVIGTDIGIKIRFGNDFDNPKADNPDPQDALEASIINFEYAKNNKVSKKKVTAPNFLDRQTEWVKLKIRDEGIYRITGASLVSSGLDITSALCSRIKVFSSAGKDIDNNPTLPVYHGAKEISRKVVDSNGNGLFEDSDYIVFYGMQTTQRDSGKTAHYFNRYSENTFYWIDLGLGALSDGKEIQDMTSTSTDYEEINVFQRHIFSERKNSLVYEGEFFKWYNAKIDPLQSISIDFNMKEIDAAYPVKLKVNHALDIGSNQSRIKYSINNYATSDTISSLTRFDLDLNNSFFTPNAVNSFSMTNMQVFDPKQDMAKYYNGYDVIYNGVVNAGSYDEYFYAQLDSTKTYRLNLENSSGRQLFDISDPYNVRYSVLNNDYCVLNADKEFNSYLLFSGSYKVPAEMKIYDNTAVKSLHSRITQADMVIISPSDFYDFFKNDEMGYIQAHLDAGHDVSSIEIVNIDEISNEFGRGYQEPAATRNFIEYAYENWGTEYVILAGDGNYYIKNELNTPEKNHIYPADPSYNYYAGDGSDDFYANLSSTSPAQHVAIGRFTVSNITELRNVVSKTISYIKNKNQGIKKSRILLVGDDERNPDFFDPDNPYDGWFEKLHIENTESLIVSEIPEYYFCDKLYSTEYNLEYSAATGLWLKPAAQDDLIRRLQNGVNVFCYIGHGAPMQLAHEKLFIPSAYSKVNNYENYFFMIGATCSFGVFNNPNVKNLAEQMLVSPNKGSVGLINSVAPVYSGDNESLVGKIFEAEFFNPVNKLTVGKALQQGKILYPSSRGNSPRFMLIGDPALMFFNDKTIVESESSLELNTLVLDSISSSLNQTTSAGISDFNGVLNNTIFDSEVKRTYFNSEKWINIYGDSIISPLEYNLPGKIILSGISTINNGNSVVKFILPKDLTYGDNKGKVLFYGYNSYGQEFTGSINSVSIRGDAEVTISDSIPPEIRICFNSLNYIAGDPIGQSPLIFAEIFDENGINTSGGIGHKIMMEIDGTATDVTPYFTYDIDNYKKGHTSYQPVDLSEGKHIIKITAWDAFNNYNERTESFEVVKASDQQSNRIGNLLNYPNPTKSKGTTFGFAVDSQSDLNSFTITVYTINGRKVKVIDNASVNPADQFQQCFWDGKDADGDTPANGVYIYVLRAKFNTGDTINKKGKLIFAR